MQNYKTYIELTSFLLLFCEWGNFMGELLRFRWRLTIFVAYYQYTPSKP